MQPQRSSIEQGFSDGSVKNQHLRSASQSLDHAPSVRDTQSVIHAEYKRPLANVNGDVPGARMPNQNSQQERLSNTLGWGANIHQSPVLPTEGANAGSGESQILIQGPDPAKQEQSEQRTTSLSPPRAARVFTRKKAWQQSSGRLPGKDPLVLHVDHLRPYFGISQRHACMQLGIGLSTMKRICRTFGIKRWPGATTCSGGGDSGNDAEERQQQSYVPPVIFGAGGLNGGHAPLSFANASGPGRQQIHENRSSCGAPPLPGNHDESQLRYQAAAPPCSGLGQDAQSSLFVFGPQQQQFVFEPQQQQQQQTASAPRGSRHAPAAVHAPLHTPVAYEQQQEQGMVASGSGSVGNEHRGPHTWDRNGSSMASVGSGSAFELRGQRQEFGGGNTGMHEERTSSSAPPPHESATAPPRYDEIAFGVHFLRSAEAQEVVCSATRRGRVSVSSLYTPGGLGGIQQEGLFPQSPASLYVGYGSSSKQKTPVDLPAAIQRLDLGGQSSSSSSSRSGPGVGETADAGRRQRSEGEWLSTIDESWLQSNTNIDTASETPASMSNGDVMVKRERATQQHPRGYSVEWDTCVGGRQEDAALSFDCVVWSPSSSHAPHYQGAYPLVQNAYGNANEQLHGDETTL